MSNVTHGTTNVFEDLGYADAGERQVKTRLALAVNDILKGRGDHDSTALQRRGDGQHFRPGGSMTMNPVHPLITVDPLRRGGQPGVRGLRISVGDVLGWLAQGQSICKIEAGYPE